MSIVCLHQIVWPAASGLYPGAESRAQRAHL